MDKTTKEVLKELEKTQEEFWNVEPAAANFLNMLIKVQNAKNALELGTSNGYSAIWLSNALKETAGHLTTIEFWDKRQCVAIENFKKCKVDDIITPLLGSACDILENLQKEILENGAPMFDFVFIDANKLEYIKYFKLIDPILACGGLILADNVTSHAKKVEPFMNEIKNREDYQSELLPFADGLLMARKMKTI